MLRVIFMGTPDFSIPALSEILNAGHELVAVYTQPPRPAGRGMGARKSPIHALADDLGLPVFTPEQLKSEAEQERFANHGADVAIVVAYGLILPKEVLDAPVHGGLNLHASLLPRWRGAAPIQRAIMAGDNETGVMIMRMDEGLDTGPVCLGERVTIGAAMAAGELHDMLARQGGDLLVRALAALERGSLDCKPQTQEGATYAKKIEKAETRIDWTRPASEVHNHIRGLSPWPGAWFEMEFGGKTERVKVLRSERASGSGASGSLIADSLTIACGSGSVRLLQLQRAGKKPMERQEFLRGVDIAPGVVLR
ncbi:methionyl-tRNA formyltransferase [bacterium MnTg02]|nr:methionyl-tRNA formyltransferase [bacterium MnTg02]